jgi:hypothetical protein
VEPFLGGSHIDVYETYAVIRCKNEYTALVMVQRGLQRGEGPKPKGAWAHS